MSLTAREWWGVVHGMGLGAVFLLTFAGGLAGLYSLKPGLITPEGLAERMRRLRIGVVAMAAAAWGTVITGTWIVYPWYREKLAISGADEFAGCAGAHLPTAECSPRDFLLSNAARVGAHDVLLGGAA